MEATREPVAVRVSGLMPEDRAAAPLMDAVPAGLAGGKLHACLWLARIVSAASVCAHLFNLRVGSWVKRLQVPRELLLPLPEPVRFQWPRIAPSGGPAHQPFVRLRGRPAKDLDEGPGARPLLH